MILIAHRGNINGPNPAMENHPDYVQAALDAGYDVEIDLWRPDGQWKSYLGHDAPQYDYWVGWENPRLWIHCKDLGALRLCQYQEAIAGNYFWHQNDDFTLTSRNWIWTFPGKPLTPNSICVMPENCPEEPLMLRGCVGVCSDYVGKYR